MPSVFQMIVSRLPTASASRSRMASMASSVAPVRSSSPAWSIAPARSSRLLAVYSPAPWSYAWRAAPMACVRPVWSVSRSAVRVACHFWPWISPEAVPSRTTLPSLRVGSPHVISCLDPSDRPMFFTGGSLLSFSVSVRP